MSDLVGATIEGVVRKTGPDHFALLVDKIPGVDPKALVRLAKKHASKFGWDVRAPRSWTLPVDGAGSLGPHVSLHRKHAKEVGKRIRLEVVGVMHWEEKSRWVALRLKGPLAGRHEWGLHMSCAQEWS